MNTTLVLAALLVVMVVAVGMQTIQLVGLSSGLASGTTAVRTAPTTALATGAASHSGGSGGVDLNQLDSMIGGC